MNSKSAIRFVLLAAVAPLALGACSWFKPKSDWDKAVEARPLEVPPDLETPPRTNDMVVPEAGGAVLRAQRPASTACTLPTVLATPGSASALRSNAPTSGRLRRRTKPAIRMN